MQMADNKLTHEKYWERYDNTDNGQITFFGGHSTRTGSLDNMPNGKLLRLINGSICITSDGMGFLWDANLQEWIPQ